MVFTLYFSLYASIIKLQLPLFIASAIMFIYFSEGHVSRFYQVCHCSHIYPSIKASCDLTYIIMACKVLNEPELSG